MTGLFATAETTRSIAVLPLQNLSNDPAQEYFSDGITDELITNLSQIAALKVISRTSVMQYKQAKKPLPVIAGELGVETVLDGSVAREGNRVRVMAELTDASTDRVLWSQSYERELSSILTLQGEISRAVANAVSVRLQPREEARFASARQVDPAAHEAYLKGMYFLNKATQQDTKKSIEYFQQAVEKDPADALAQAGLALAYVYVAWSPWGGEEEVEQAKAAATRALQLDDTLGEAHAALGLIEGYTEWKWEDGFRELQRAIDSSPDLTIAYVHRAWWNVLFGRMHEAMADHQRAEELDPLNPWAAAWFAELYRMEGRYDEAIAEARKAIEVSPGLGQAHWVLGLVYQDQGNYDEAIQSIKKAGEVAPGMGWLLGPAYVAAGRTDDARNVLAELNQRPPNKWNARCRVMLYAALGDKDEAFRWMDYEPHHLWVPWVRVNTQPGMAELRKDPRFAAELRRMNVPSLGDSSRN